MAGSRYLSIPLVGDIDGPAECDMWPLLDASSENLAFALECNGLTGMHARNLISALHLVSINEVAADDESARKSDHADPK